MGKMGSRIVSLFLVITVLMLVLLLQIVNINNMNLSSVSQNQGEKTLEIATKRGMIYDRNFKALVDNQFELIAAVGSGDGVLGIPSLDMSKDEIAQKLKKGVPFLTKVSQPIDLESAKSFEVPIRYGEQSMAQHLIGYLDYDKQTGVSGIEKAYNQQLKTAGGTLSVSFEVDAYGRAIQGLDKVINDENFTSKAGVVLTLDSKIQQITETALKNSQIKSGCAVVMHVDTGEIYAMASVPNFDQNDVGASLNQENSPLLNKSLQAYSVGSVFKPIVAAAALENGISEHTKFECKGSIQVGDTVYKCYNNAIHGEIDMTQALEVSCNCYFISLMQKIDTDYLLKLCNDIGFSNENELAQTYFSVAGKLPTAESLTSLGSLASFAFGQGEFSATPIQMLSAYHVLATGNKISPTVIRGTANENGLMRVPTPQVPQKLLTDSTAKKVSQMLSSVVENGNATNAKSSIVSVSGKTGTAQSGIYIDNKEVCRTWFVGFCASENPNYIIAVLNENGSGGNVECAPVFKEICEEISKIN